MHNLEIFSSFQFNETSFLFHAGAKALNRVVQYVNKKVIIKQV